MDNSDMLARLLDHAADQGHDPASLRAMIEEASALGAARALRRLGLADESASEDIAELRELLSAWRDAKKSAWTALVQWLVRGALALLIFAIAVKIGQTDLLK